jgi:hypothetical protein
MRKGAERFMAKICEGRNRDKNKEVVSRDNKDRCEFVGWIMTLVAASRRGRTR